MSIKWRLKGLLASTNFNRRFLAAAIRARGAQGESTEGICFIAGCGRSGTTLLGRLMSLGENVTYLNEPRQFWAAINPRTDVWGYCVAKPTATTLLLDQPRESDPRRFSALVSHLRRVSNKVSTPE